MITNLYKIFSKIITKRINPYLDIQQPPEQAGFRSSYSVCEHLQSVQQIVEKANEYNIPIYIAFIDYNKAFDSIEHNSLWNALKNDGVPNKYIRIIKKIYEDSKALIKLESKGMEFKIGRGVKQGDPMSPKLFNSVLQSIFLELRDKWENFGISINGQYLTNLRFADDIVLFSKQPQELKIMIKDLQNESIKVGLSMNMSKTKLMKNNSDNLEVSIDNHKLEVVEKYTYLGQTVAFRDWQEEEIERRIQQSWNKYWGLKHIFKNKDVPNNLKAKTFNSCIVPTLTYGCQTWALNKKQVQKLKVTQRNMERNVLKIRLINKISKKEIREKSKFKDVINLAKTGKWNWAGHVARTGNERWSKNIITWLPRHFKRKQGRPVTRWRDEIVAYESILWCRTALNKKEWKKKGEAFAQQWDDI